MKRADNSRRWAGMAATAALCGLLSAPPSAADTASEETVYYGERCFGWDEALEGSCPASSEADSALAAWQDPDDCPIIEVEEGSRYTGEACCYDVVMAACYEYASAGCLDAL